MYVINSLLPIFLLIALGNGLSRTPLFSGDFFRGVNRLAYWVALPALLVDKITHATFRSGDMLQIVLLLILASIASAVISALLARAGQFDRKTSGAFVQGASRANDAFIGLPVILYAMGSINPDVGTLATVVLAPAIVFYNLLSIVILMLYSDRNGKSPRSVAFLFVRQIITNPLLIACVAGFLFNHAGVTFPAPIQRSLSALGGSALALALLSIGAALSFKGLAGRLGLSLGSSAVKVFIQPLIGFGLALVCNLPPVGRQILLIYLACPTAVASYIMADVFDSDRDLAAHIIVVSTLLSAVSLSLIIALGG
ncbi:MAG: AEC family transporter [Kiritimatiellales bacterium]